MGLALILFFFFFNDTATTEIYTLSLHDALPISSSARALRTRTRAGIPHKAWSPRAPPRRADHPGPFARHSRLRERGDRKSTRLNSSHLVISYAVFCLKKKKRAARSTDVAPRDGV